MKITIVVIALSAGAGIGAYYLYCGAGNCSGKTAPLEPTNPSSPPNAPNSIVPAPTNTAFPTPTTSPIDQPVKAACDFFECSGYIRVSKYDVVRQHHGGDHHSYGSWTIDETYFLEFEFQSI